MKNIPNNYWKSLVGSVIQATGTVEFEDGLWIWIQLRAGNGLQRVSTLFEVLPDAVCVPRFHWGQNEFQSTEIHVTAWCQAQWSV